jgi:hypothetical protein
MAKRMFEAQGSILMCLLILLYLVIKDNAKSISKITMDSGPSGIKA